jgi:hypothetical protein
MATPQVIFRNLPISAETDILYQFLFKSSWSKFILQYHPKLSRVFKIQRKNERLSFIKNYVTKLRKEDKGLIKRAKNRFQNEWRKIEQQAFTALSEVMEIPWPKQKKHIKVFLSVNPVCPRFLESWEFTIFYKFNINQIKEVILHECCHFLYFKKWKLIFPKSQSKTFETPHIEWHLSEIMAPIILNDPKIRRFLKHRVLFHTRYYKIKIKNVSAAKYFSLLYSRHKVKGSSFDNFLKSAYSEIKKYSNKFKE